MSFSIYEKNFLIINHTELNSLTIMNKNKLGIVWKYVNYGDQYTIMLNIAVLSVIPK
jgi:hypothetical protein